MDSIEVKYKGFTIRYSEDEEGTEWEVLDANKNVASRRKTLKQAQKYVDGLSKKTFEPYQALKSKDYWSNNDFKTITVTSIDEDNQVWIKDEHGRRSKTSREYLYVLSPENLALIQEIKEKTEQSEKIDNEIDKLKKRMKAI